jgi:hypothetical protein
MRIWCDGGREISLKPVGGDVEYAIADKDANVIIPKGQTWGNTKQRGYHAITAYGSGGFAVDASYTSTFDLQLEECGL